MRARRVVVHLHALAADLAGAREVVLGLDGEATSADLKRALGAAHPGLEGLLGSGAVATEREYLADAAPLGPGDRFHFVPPVSGG
jgi:molybdopterin converting factor small subunit